MGGRVALFVTCVADVVEPEVAAAAVRLVRAAGCEVSCPSGQTCCGQPAWNAGFADEAAAVARTSLAALEADPAETVVVPAGSCATMIRLYWPHLFRTVGDADAAARSEQLAGRVRELSEHLADHDVALDPSTPTARVAYHRSCHMQRELHVVDQPADLLSRAGVDVAAWDGDDRCCGFGGTFSVKLPEASTAMADDKLDSLPDGVDTIVGCDSSCLLQLRGRAEERGIPLRIRHLAEVLADHLADRPVDGPADG